MSRDEVVSFANAPHEDKSHEVKGPVPWTDRCFKGDLLRDVAGLANSGGGVLLVGRDSPNFATGSLSEAEQDGYDIANVGADIRNYISTTLQLVVHRVEVGANRLIGIEIAASLRSPAIMLQAFNCANHPLHFRAGDIYVRTNAGETRLLSTFPEIDEMLNRIVDYRLTEELQRLKVLGMF
jgi:hypothetical protein